MLSQKNLDELLIRPAGFAHFREYVLLFQCPLVVLLAEFPEQLGSIRECLTLDPAASSRSI